MIREPLTDEAVQRRQRGDGHRADEEEERRLGHPLDQAPHLLHVPRVRRMQHGAGAEEQQPFERGMVEGVVQPRDQRQRRQNVVAAVQKHQCRAQTHEDDADVFDAVIGKQTLEVVFHQRVEHTQHGGDCAHCQHGHSPPERRRAEEIEQHPGQSVDACLDDHTGHERGDVAGRDRMRLRQPDVQRHDARLDAETEQEQDERRVTFAGRHFSAEAVQAVEAVIARGLEQQQETEDDAPGVDVRHDEVKHTRIARLGLIVLEAHEAISRQRHDLPGDEEQPDVVRHEDECRGQQQRVEKRAEHADVFAPEETLHVAERVGRKREAQQRDDQKEKPAERVDPNGELDVRIEGGQQLALGCWRSDSGCKEEETGEQATQG